MNYLQLKELKAKCSIQQRTKLLIKRHHIPSIHHYDYYFKIKKETEKNYIFFYSGVNALRPFSVVPNLPSISEKILFTNSGSYYEYIVSD